MAVLIIAENKGQTAEGYDGMLAQMGDRVKHVEGRVLHASHATEDGWRVVEVWESKDAANRWFAANVAPHLPPGIRPRRTFHELHLLMAP
jgi:hypothetical protein